MKILIITLAALLAIPCMAEEEEKKEELNYESLENQGKGKIYRLNHIDKYLTDLTKKINELEKRVKKLEAVKTSKVEENRQKDPKE